MSTEELQVGTRVTLNPNTFSYIVVEIFGVGEVVKSGPFPLIKFKSGHFSGYPNSSFLEEFEEEWDI